jgi:hypothetical protein
MLTLVLLRSLHIAASWASCSAPLAEFSASCCCMGVGNNLMLSKLYILKKKINYRSQMEMNGKDYVI